MLVALYQYSKTGRNRLIVSSVEDVNTFLTTRSRRLFSFNYRRSVRNIGVLLSPFQHT